MIRPRIYKAKHFKDTWFCEGYFLYGNGKTPEIAYRDWYAKMQLIGKIK